MLRDKFSRFGPLAVALLLAVFCTCVLRIYHDPMEDVSLDLSLALPDDVIGYDPAWFDSKGWTVYTQTGDARTELIPDGFGGYTGLQLGQTFYFSRVIEEELDSPTLQLGVVEQQFSVWLDDTLIYTDCPTLDNRIGYVQLPMSQWFRESFITISLPGDYQGRTLTIAQSFPEWSETGSVTAWPTFVHLYCGYAYESELISEATRTMLRAGATFLLTMILLVAFVRSREWNVLCLAMAGVALCWVARFFFIDRGFAWDLILLGLRNGQIDYVYTHTMTGATAAALITAVAEAVKSELNRRAEQHLMQQRQELSMASYENLYRQHEEVMMLRHDMIRHFRTLRDMDAGEKRTAYLSELIGQNEKIRPVVDSGNEMLDIILNARLSAAVDAGIRVDIPHVSAPDSLPLSDPDLCALVMNIVDNAIAAASAAPSPCLLLKIHQRDGFLGIVCENSCDPNAAPAELNKKTVPKHGLGLKIVKNIVAKYSGAITEQKTDDRFIVKLAIPL